MTTEQELVAFLERAREDARIGPIHISTFTAILYLQVEQGAAYAVQISARKLMPLAKICGNCPYHRHIRQLHDYGYLTYEPSCDPSVPSRVWIGRR